MNRIQKIDEILFAANIALPENMESVEFVWRLYKLDLPYGYCVDNFSKHLEYFDERFREKMDERSMVEVKREY